MRFLYALIIWTFISASQSWSETLTFDFLVENEAQGLVYKKFSTIPFTGTVIPNSNFPMQGSFKEGKREGYWEYFYESGVLRAKLDYENGMAVGLAEYFHSNGQLSSRGTLKNSMREGLWEGYDSSGVLSSKGDYLQDNKEGAWEYFYDNGGLREKGSYQQGKKEGLWEYFNYEGHLTEKGAYKNGLKDGPWQETEGDRKAGVNYKNGEKEKKLLSLAPQIEACWFRDTRSLSEQVKLTVVVSLDQNGRVNPNSIQVVEISGGNREAQKVAFRRAKIAIIECGRNGYQVPKEMLGQEIELIFDPT